MMLASLASFHDCQSLASFHDCQSLASFHDCQSLASFHDCQARILVSTTVQSLVSFSIINRHMFHIVSDTSCQDRLYVHIIGTKIDQSDRSVGVEYF